MKLEGGTIIESLVAMVILVVALGTATMIYTNVLDSDKQAKELKAWSLVQEELSEMLNQNRFIDQERSKDGLYLSIAFANYALASDVTQISWIVKDENEIIVLKGDRLLYNR